MLLSLVNAIYGPTWDANPTWNGAEGRMKWNENVSLAPFQAETAKVFWKLEEKQNQTQETQTNQTKKEENPGFFMY